MVSFSVLNSGCRRATSCYAQNDPEVSGAFGCCIERTEIARVEKLFALYNFDSHYLWSGSSTSPPAVRKVDGISLNTNIFADLARVADRVRTSRCFSRTRLMILIDCATARVNYRTPAALVKRTRRIRIVLQT
eukprot:2697518-Pyramimonas_sp.AAC.1